MRTEKKNEISLSKTQIHVLCLSQRKKPTHTKRNEVKKRRKEKQDKLGKKIITKLVLPKFILRS